MEISTTPYIKRSRFSFLLILMLLLLCAPTVRASKNLYPLKPPDTSSPRATMKFFNDLIGRAHQKSLQSGYKDEAVLALLNRAAECFDLSEIAPSLVQDVGVESALLLKEIFDRIEVPPYKEIPGEETAGFDALTSWTVPNTPIKIVKVEKEPRKGEFLFSTGTVARMKELYKRAAQLPYKPGASTGAYLDYIYAPGPMIPKTLIQKLPSWAEKGLYDQAIWQWIGLFVTFFFAALVVVAAFRWARTREADPPKMTDPSKIDEEDSGSRWSWRKLVCLFIWMLIILMTESFVTKQINITGDVQKYAKLFLRIMFFIASGWTIVVIGNGIAEAIITSKRLFARTIDANLVRLITRLVTVLLLGVLLWNTTDYLGMSFTAVFASAGIAGLGVALAARETLANFFGGVSIFLDRPFKSGDYIVLDTGERGQVVYVGLRSTRILTRDEIQISIPNSLITNSKIVNESAPHPRLRVRIKVSVAYGTDVDRMEEILLTVAGHNSMVAVSPEPRVRFRNFGDSSLDFELLCWTRRPEDKGRLIHGLNHQINNAFEAANIQIPFPQRDIHLNADSKPPESAG